MKTITRNRHGREQSVERLTQQGFNASDAPRRLTEAAIDEGGKLGYGLAMSPDATLLLQKIMDYCHEKWGEVDRPPASEWPTADMQLGRKMALNDVLQFSRKLLNEKVREG